jgi:outer membrane protein assembly factor BamB
MDVEDTGRLAWTVETGGQVRSSPAALVVKVGDEYEEVRVFAGSYDGHLYGICGSTGAIRFKTDLKGSIYSSPAVDSQNGFVYCATTKGEFHLQILEQNDKGIKKS